jgi:hypothetical protein
MIVAKLEALGISFYVLQELPVPTFVDIQAVS